MKLRCLLLTALLTAASAAAAPHQFANGEAVTLEPDQGYVLVRTSQRPGGALRGTVKYTPLLIRLLSPEKMDQAKALASANPTEWMDKVEPNVVEPLADRPYVEGKGRAVLVMPLKPGTYVLGGLAVTNWAVVSQGVVATSLCMGTVKFEVKPGVITDMGMIVNAPYDEPTNIPELSGIVVGKRIGFAGIPEDVAVRPYSPAMETPEKLRGLVTVPADYRAVMPYPNYLGAPLGRLAPLAGVLDYDKDGKVIDLKEAPESPTPPSPSSTAPSAPPARP